MTLWLLAFHIIFVVAWFAGLFYLPRLFVYHAETTDGIGITRFKVMEHKLYYYITTPAGILATIFGLALLLLKFNYYFQQPWMHIKLGLVVILWVFHLACGKLLRIFKENRNQLSHKFYRWFNEIPTVLLIAIVILAIVQPW